MSRVAWVQSAIAIVVGAMAIAGIVWAGGGQSQKLTSHVGNKDIHMTPAIHTALGEINGKLDTIDTLLRRRSPNAGVRPN